jgi:hypothetical protein
MALKICPPINFKFRHFSKRGLPNFKLEIVCGIHEVTSSKQGELKDYLIKILEHTPIIIEIDVEIEGLFATFNLSVGMPESILLDPIATPPITKQKSKKINIVRKF